MMRRAVTLLLLGTFLFAGGCAYVAGGAVAGILLLGQDEENGGGTTPQPFLPSASVAPLSGTFTGRVVITYTLYDANGDPADVTVEFTPDGGSNFYPALEYTGVGTLTEGTTGLSATPTGAGHTFEWDAATDTALDPFGYNIGVFVRITPREPGGPAGTPGSSGNFTVRYNSTPTATVNMPGGLLKFDIPVYYYLADLEADPAAVTPEYSTTSASAGFSAATQGAGGEGTTGLSTSAIAPGVQHLFTWNSFADIGPANTQVWFRITPTDETTSLAGTGATVGPFWVGNDVMLIVIGTGQSDFSSPFGLCLDGSGNVYIADSIHSQIKVLNTQSSLITVAGVAIAPGELGVIAGTGVAGYNGDNRLATTANLNWPYSVAVDNSTGDVYVADTGNHRIRRIDGFSGFITTLAGDGTAGSVDNCMPAVCRLNGPRGIALDTATPPNLYICDTDNHGIRFVNRSPSSITVANTIVNPGLILAVSGTLGPTNNGNQDGVVASAATWDTPWGIAIDGQKNLFVADSNNNWIRVLNDSGSPLSVGTVTVPDDDVQKVAGGNGTAGYAGDTLVAVASDASVAMDRPAEVCLDGAGNIYFCDSSNHAVRAVNTQAAGSLVVGSVTIAAGNIDTVAGGTGNPGSVDNVVAVSTTSDILHTPRGLGTDASGNLYVADSLNDQLRCVNATGAQITVAGVTIASGYIRALKGSAGVNITLANPMGSDRSGNLLYIADGAGGHRIVSYDITAGTTALVAGTRTAGSTDGPSATAMFDSPADVAVNAAGTFLVVADRGNDELRFINISSGSIGSPYGYPLTVGPDSVITLPASATVLRPSGVAIAGGANPDLYVADRDRHRVIRIDWSGTVTNVAGITNTPGYTGDGAAATSANLNSPAGVALDSAGNLFICDTGNHAIRAVDQTGSFTFGTVIINQSGDIDTIAGVPPPGGPTSGYNGDNRPGLFAELDSPVDPVVDTSGHVFFCDANNHRIRRLDAGSGIITTVAGTGTAGFNGDRLPPENSDLNGPQGLCLDGAGVLYVSDSLNRILRRFSP
jgi:sugar lactone lactonase YvrE